MHSPRRILLVFGLVPLAGWLSLASVRSADRDTVGSKPLALVGGQILTQTDAGSIEGTVLIRDGKIVAVGANVSVPEDADRIDVKGMVVTPGLIDARSTLWLSPAGVREGASDGGLNVLDDIDPHGEDWKEVVRQGITAVYVQPAATGILGGRGAVLRVRPAETVEDLVIQADAALQAALGTSVAAAQTVTLPTFVGRIGPEPPAAAAGSGNSLARYAQYEQLKRAFEAVRRPPGEMTKAAPAKGVTVSRPRREPSRELLGRVLKGEIPLRLEAHHEDDIHNALRLADEFKLRLILDGVGNPGTAAAELASRRVPLVLGPFVEVEEPPTYRAGQASSLTAARRGGRRQPAPAQSAPTVSAAKQSLERTNVSPGEGSRWALGTFSDQPRGSRLLRVQAGAAVAQGMDPEHVLRAMTRDAAEILGIADRFGSIAAGKQADLAVFAGDPLDPSVPVRLVVSQGKVLFRNKVGQSSTEPPVASPAPTIALPTRLPKKYALQTQRFMTEDGSYRPATILVDGGKVTAIGSSDVPDGVPIFDLGMAVVSPGLVAGASDLGFAGAIDDPAEADAGHVRAGDVFDSQYRSVRKMLEGGFTSVLLIPGSANVLAGTCSAFRLGTGEANFSDTGVKLVLTASSRAASRASVSSPDDGIPPFLAPSRGGPARYPGSLAGQIELIEQVLAGRGPETELYLPGRIRQQIQAERRRQVTALLDRKRVAVFEAHSRAEVDGALRLVERFQLRAVLVGPDEVKPFLPEIKRLGVGVVARPVQTGDYDRPLLEFAEAADAGVAVAFAGSAQEVRMTAALAMNLGMPRGAAWHGLTAGAAKLAGMPDGTGRLQSGGKADLVIWTGPPLNLCSRPLHVLVDGKLVNAVR
jgi:imidazolonepropionase-like amidohydrolase